MMVEKGQDANVGGEGVLEDGRLLDKNTKESDHFLYPSILLM